MNTTIKNILKWIVIAGLFLTPFIPFIVTRSLLFPFITGKGFTFRIVVEIIFALWLLLALADATYRPKWNYITKSIVVFVGIVFLADLFSKYSYKSFWSNFERMEGFVTIIHLAFYYFVLSSMFNTATWWKHFWNVTLGASVIMSIYGILQIIGKITVDQGGVRLDATFGNASYLAIYMVFGMFIALFLLYAEEKKWLKWTYGAVFVLQAVILYYTATRGAILGFIGGIVLAALMVAWRERQNKTIRKVALSFFGLVVAVVLIFIAVRNTSFVQKSPVLSRFSTLSYSDLQTQGRYYVWPMALKGAIERPILGWGQESFNYVFNANYNPAMWNQEQWFDRTHNIVLDWLINAGVLGLLAYISIYAAFLYVLWKKSTFSFVEKSVLTGMIAAYVFNNMFVFDNLISYMLFFAVLAWVSSNSRQTTGDSQQMAIMKTPKKFSSETINFLFAPVIVIALALCIYFVNVPAILASQSLIQAISQQSAGPQTNLDEFTKTFAYNSFGTSEALEQLTSVAVQIISGQYDNTVKQGFLNLTDKEIKLQISRTPQDARYLLLAGSFYNRVGQYDTAIGYLNSAIMYSPNKPSIYFELGSTYVAQGNYDKAFQLFTQGYNLAPQSPDGQAVYAIGALYDKKADVVKQMFAILGQDAVVNDDRILSAYVTLKDYASAETLLTLRLQKNPNNYNNELALASVYANAGDKAKAIALIKDVETKNPSLKSQLDPYIQQLSQ